jgi:allantoicase
MDGWESRRKRTEGHDWVIVQLATTGKIAGVDIDTNHFLGNHPPFASLEAAVIPDAADLPEDPARLNNVEWKEIIPKSALQPGAQNFFDVTDTGIYNHIKLHIYPDGGVARMKVYGEVYKDWSGVDRSEVINLAAALNGAKSISCNDMFFSHMQNLLMPGRGINMGDGWETKRNRNPGNRDWVIIRLAHRGNIEKILVDTAHFKGNYPDSCLIEGIDIPYKEEANLENQAEGWKTLLPRTKLEADKEHFFEDEINEKGPYSHIRLSIFPDGGISRLRLWGRIV